MISHNFEKAVDNYSELINARFGVPQGSILTPVLSKSRLQIGNVTNIITVV